MTVRVKLLGTLPSFFPGSYPPEGVVLDIQVGITVAGLVALLGINREKISLVTVNGILAKEDDMIPDEAIVKLIQPIMGG